MNTYPDKNRWDYQEIHSENLDLLKTIIQL